MCSVLQLREFIKERLTAACEEIFSEVQKTVVQYEEEISRQRGLLDMSRRPDTNSHITDMPQQHDYEEEEGLTDYQVCNQESNSSLKQEDLDPPQIKDEQEDPEVPHIKKEQEELCSSQEGEELELKQEADTFLVTLTYEETDQSEPETNSEQLLSHSSPEAEVKKRRPHRKRRHGQRAGKTPVSQSQRQTDARKKSLQCDTCGKPFLYKCQLTAHLKIHTGEKPHSCITCGKKFRQKAELELHLRLHTGENLYPCNTCGKKFNRKSYLERHARIHTGEKPYSCSTCGKRFGDNSALKIHVRIHTGEKPHSCIICGKGFIQKSTLKIHIRAHTGEKPYSCGTCGKRFRDSSSLRTHVRIHTGEKPHSCSTCGKRFLQSGNLKSHMRLHTR